MERNRKEEKRKKQRNESEENITIEIYRVASIILNSHHQEDGNRIPSSTGEIYLNDLLLYKM